MSKRSPPLDVAPAVSKKSRSAWARVPPPTTEYLPPFSEMSLARTKPAFDDASITFQGGVVDPIQPSQNPEPGISFGSEIDVDVPKASSLVDDATNLDSDGSSPTTKGSPSALYRFISADQVLETSNVEFEYTGSTSNQKSFHVHPAWLKSLEQPWLPGPTLVPITQPPQDLEEPQMVLPLQELLAQLPPLPPPPPPPPKLPKLVLPGPPNHFDSAAPTIPFSLPPQSDSNNYEPDPAAESSREPFSTSSPLCLDGQISGQSKYVVASGGYADIWTGSFRNKTVAIKIMRPFSAFGSHIEISKILKRSWREYLAWSRSHHPNILDCLGFSYDFSPQADQPSLVSPWMSNGTAIDHLNKNPNIDRVAIVADIARGLVYLHEMDPTIVHGDIRAGNVLVSDSGVACLSDFGLSKILGDFRGLTTSSEVAGSARWMAPELLQGSNVSVQSDAWAYGMTVLEILTGTRPYSETAPDASVLLKIVKGELPARPMDVPVITDDVWTLCHKCWQILPEKRPSMNDVLAKIERVREGKELQWFGVYTRTSARSDD